MGLPAENMNNLRPSQFIERTFFLPPTRATGGMPLPYSFNGCEYLIPLHDGGFQEIVMKTGRQVYKTTTLGLKFLTWMMTNPGFRVMYCGPSDNVLKVFSEEKLEDFFQFTPLLKDYFLKGDKNSGISKKFSFWKFINGSSMRLANAARQGANFRGPSNSAIGIDELQNMPPDTIPIAQETLFASDWKLEVFSGTPLTIDNQLEQEWKKTNQCEWVIPCPHCSGGDRTYFNIVGLRNLSPVGLICDRCEKRIDPSRGMWVAMCPSSSRHGVRIPQPISPMADMNEIYYKKVKGRSLDVVMNEVLGLSYDSAASFITMQNIKDVSNDALETIFKPPTRIRSMRTFAGIDWSLNTPTGHYNAIVIGVAEGDKWRVAYCRIYPKAMRSTEQFNHMIKVMENYNVNIVAPDFGSNGDRNLRIAEILGDPRRVLQVSTIGSNTFFARFDQETAMCRLGRTAMLSSFRSDFTHRNKIVFPKLDDPSFKPFIQHILAEKQEVTRNGNLQFILPAGEDDDGLMALALANIAFRELCKLPLVDTIYMPDIEKVRKMGDML